MAISIPDPMEVCPNCGDIVSCLNEISGWCYDCSPARCEKCGGERTSDDHKLCIKCQREQWLERNADQMELYISQGLTYTEAKQKIICENRAICIVCSSPIPGKHKQNTLFCKKTQSCRKARKKYLDKVRSGVPRELALETVLREALA